MSKYIDLKNYLFYSVKPLLPRKIQLFLRRRIAAYQRKKYANIWPINERAATPPPGWKGWPEGKKFALVLQHDVDTKTGHDNVSRLMDLEECLGVRSTFFIVPERYPISSRLLDEINNRGFGLGVHGLKHDGRLFSSYELFMKSAARINNYLRTWNVSGFSSPSMLRKLEWMHHLDMEYSTSTFDTDPFEPQPDAGNTIFPILIHYKEAKKGFVELPYTLPQDFTLFIILKERNNEIWKRKIDWIVQKKGMALLNTHPDYMNFHTNESEFETYPVERYIDFIKYVQSAYNGQYWHVLTRDVGRYIFPCTLL